MSRNTKTRLLDEAEQLFADRGMDATSVRDVTNAAEANVASVKFHFGNKQGLVTAVFLRRLRPLMEKRQQNLSDLRGRDVPPEVEDLLQAFLAPLIEMSRETAPGTQAFLRLFARTLVEPAPFIEDVFLEEFGPYTQAYFQAFAEVITHIPKSELADRLDFMIGTIGHALSDPVRRKLAHRTADGGGSNYDENLLKHLIHFVLTGLTAPAA